MVALIDADEEARAGGFDAAAYHSFREAELLRVAVEMAAGDRFDALKVVFEKEEDELRAQRLHVLGAVSETTPPREYGELLQEIVDEAIGEEDEEESEEEESEEEEEGEEEDGEVKAAAAARRAERAAAREARAVARAAERQVARAELVGWVSRRAREIDARSGQLGHAQELLELASELGLRVELKPLLQRVRQLGALVYDWGCHASLDEFEGLDAPAKLKLLIEHMPDFIADGGGSPGRGGVAAAARGGRAAEYTQAALLPFLRAEPRGAALLADHAAALAADGAAGSLERCAALIHASRPDGVASRCARCRSAC